VVAPPASLRAQPPKEFLIGKLISVGGRGVGLAFHSVLFLVSVGESCSMYRR